MPNRIQLGALIVVIVFLWVVGLWVDGVVLTMEMILPFSFVLGITYVALRGFENLLWRWKWFYPWLVNKPNINGTWKATIHSTWIDPATNQRIAPITSYMVIKQTFSEVYIRLITPESASETLVGRVVHANDGSYEIVCIYRNEPNQGVRERSEIHYGGMRITAGGRYPIRMKARYWTDRSSTGDIDLEERRKKRFVDFETASLEFSDAATE